MGDGKRFTRVPRFDLATYAQHVPRRVTGPNGASCVECHLADTIGGGGDGSGPSALNNVQDLAGLAGVADPRNFVERNPPHLFGLGGTQLVAEEMTRDLQRIRSAAIARACAGGRAVSEPLASKGVSFGRIRVEPRGCPAGTVDASGVEGVDADLVVKPFGWKGTFPSVRLFSAGAFFNELGMTPTELSGPDVDLDFDGVSNEITIDDVTAMTIYMAAQPRPTTRIELDRVRRMLVAAGEGARADELQLPALSARERERIGRGEGRFAQVGCADCHVPALETSGASFAEPSPLADFRYDFGVDPRLPRLLDPARPFRDFKRHDMGRGLAESIGEPEPLNPDVRIAPSVFRTRELWGVANTAPYLHDGRASTLEEAILEHGGEAANARERFRRLPPAGQADLLAFLDNLVLYFPAEEE